MWAATLAGTHRRPAGRSSGSRSLHGSARTGTLEDRLTALGHSPTLRHTGTRTSAGIWPRSYRRWRRRSVHRPRASLRNNQPPLWAANRLTGTHCRRRRRPRRNLVRRHHRSRTHARRRHTGSWTRNHRRRRSCRNWCGRLMGGDLSGFRRRGCLGCDINIGRGDLVFNDRFRRLHGRCGLHGSSRRRRLRRNNNRSWRTSYGLRCDESRSRLLFDRSNRRGTHNRCRRLGRNRRRRSYGLSRRLRSN
jgi:hypothetical protein